MSISEHIVVRRMVIGDYLGRVVVTPVWHVRSGRDFDEVCAKAEAEFGPVRLRYEVRNGELWIYPNLSGSQTETETGESFSNHER